jgi:methylenetetrahydrofolate--tRNA-(uracil-5-)-methyltransferase
MVPALARAEFLRYGAAHRNTYIASPGVVDATLELKPRPGVFLAGQLTGVEGYVESAATGVLAGLNAIRVVRGAPPVYPPRETALGALVRYLAAAPLSTFAPMNFNFGLLPAVGGGARPTRRGLFVDRARTALTAWLREVAS